jgi:tRNA nucleotidyltransferase/poly(A) polymerase
MMPFSLQQISPAALHVMWLLDAAGFEGRVCGGAIRDLILNKEPKDWDVSTTALPEQVMAVMEKAGIQVVPTGLQHGTVTAVIGTDNIEITTLRVDVATDGRHADVEFTTDWYQDSLRRDFTINALYLDANLKLYDYHNGLDDLEERLVRFVGNAADRINEDYLRILRYFRFRARISPENTGDEAFVINTQTMETIRELAPNLATISGERIWAEISKILLMDRERCVLTFGSMEQTGVLKHINLGCIKATDLKFVPDDRPAVILASAAVSKTDKADVLKVLKTRFKVSRDEFGPVEFAIKHADTPATRINAVNLLAMHRKDDVLAWTSMYEPVDHTKFGTMFRKPVLYTTVHEFVVPEFPITGQDILDLGFTPGPEVGRILHELRKVWAGVEFNANRTYLINLVYQTKGHIQ